MGDLVLTDALQNVVTEIADILGQLSSKAKLGPYFRVGELLAQINEAPESYLTEEQLMNYPKPSLLLSSLFIQENGSSCSEYFIGAEAFYKSVALKIRDLEGLEGKI